ncbi:MAG: hypothetical protein ABIP75_16430 [Pyrinomonadaceae bacterium]
MKRSGILTSVVALACVVLVVAGCGLFGSPTATYKAYYEAAKKKDATALKKSLSKGTLDLLEKAAKAQDKSMDDLLKDDSFSKDLPDKLPESRNEKIDGDTATLEIKEQKSGDWITMPFVKEDGSWKLAIDKFVKDQMKK